MAGFTGKAFLLGIQHLDARSRELFERHGARTDGRWNLVHQIVDEAMLRLAGAELASDPYGTDRQR